MLQGQMLSSEQETELLGAPMSDMMLGLWLAHCEEQGMGHWMPGPGKAFILTDVGSSAFLLGRSPDGALFFGAGPSVGDWFLDLNWKLVLSSERSLRLKLDYDDDEFEIVIPVRPMVFDGLPKHLNKIELSTLRVEGVASGVDYERTRTITVPYRHEGGR